MDIHAHGEVTAHTTYQHVGYISAYAQGGRIDQGLNLSAGAMLAAGLVLTVWGLRAARLSHGRRGLTIVAGVVSVVGAATAVVGLWGTVWIDNVTPSYRETLLRIEKASALTEEWRTEHGDLPLRSEWLELVTLNECFEDAWGAPLRYGRVPEALTHDGQDYAIVAFYGDDRGLVPELGPYKPDEPQHFTEYFWDSAFSSGISSTQFGPDGIYGTEDDGGSLERWISHIPWRPDQLRHGRAAREVL